MPFFGFPDTYNLAADWVLARVYSGELCLHELLFVYYKLLCSGRGHKNERDAVTPRINGAELGRMSRNGHPISMYKPIKLKKMKKTKISVTMRNGLVVTSYYYPLFATLQDAVCNIVTNMGYSPNDVVLVK